MKLTRYCGSVQYRHVKFVTRKLISRCLARGGYATAISLATLLPFASYAACKRSAAELPVTIQGTRPVFAFYNLAVRKQFWNKKASIGFTASDPFAQYVNQTTVTNGTNFTQTNLRQIPFRSFGITLSYKFGKLEFKKEKEKDKEEKDNNDVPAPDNGGNK